MLVCVCVCVCLHVQEVIHRHIVQRISFIARDVSDARAFGYVYGCRDGRHQFYGIKTEKVVRLFAALKWRITSSSLKFILSFFCSIWFISFMYLYVMHV